MEIVNLKPKDGHQQKLVDEYRAKLFGKSCVKSAPERYWELGLMLDLKLTPHEWDSYSLDEQAQIMAYQYLKRMQETVDRHVELQEEARERLSKKNKGK